MPPICMWYLFFNAKTVFAVFLSSLYAFFHLATAFWSKVCVALRQRAYALLRFSPLRCYLFGEGVKLCDAEATKPFEGHGPEDACEEDDDEVADDSACVGIACAEGGEGCGES